MQGKSTAWALLFALSKFVEFGELISNYKQNLRFWEALMYCRELYTLIELPSAFEIISRRNYLKCNVVVLFVFCRRHGIYYLPKAEADFPPLVSGPSFEQFLETRLIIAY